jgi:ABC-type spermidine/putrescine transport system permease subunit II
MKHGKTGVIGSWIFAACVLFFLYLPLGPPILFSVSQGGASGTLQELTLKWYAQLGDNPVLMGSLQTTIILGLITALITPLLGLLAAIAVRELKVPRLILMLILLPLFIPGVSMGLATAFFFRQIGVVTTYWTIAVVHILWALPFATLIILTVMASYDPSLTEAAYVLGSNRLRAFLTVELPLIWPGIFGAGLFSLILSYNETVRTALVQGPLNTVQTYIWSNYLQVGLSTEMYALMSLMILLTLILVGSLMFSRVRGLRKTAKISSG